VSIQDQDQDPGESGLSEVRGLRAEVFSRTDLPTIPVVLAQILAVVAGERSSARDLVEVIEHDQALTSRVLKLANSALFGLSREVATVPRAVILVGFTTVRNLALGVKVWDALMVGGRQGGMVETLWHHSALVAAAAKLVAGRIQGVDPDVSFTAGLLHDVGKLVLSLKLGMRYWTLVGAADECRAVDLIERQHLGVDHAQVGGWLLEAWRLPVPIVAAIRDHHKDSPGDGAKWSPARVVCVTDRLVRGTDFTTGEQGPLATEVLERTAGNGFTAESWTEVLPLLKSEADTMSALFKVK